MLGVARQLADAHHCVTALTQSASILLDLGAPEPAMVFVVYLFIYLFSANVFHLLR